MDSNSTACIDDAYVFESDVAAFHRASAGISHAPSDTHVQAFSCEAFAVYEEHVVQPEHGVVAPPGPEWPIESDFRIYASRHLPHEFMTHLKL